MMAVSPIARVVAPRFGVADPMPLLAALFFGDGHLRRLADRRGVHRRR